MDILQLDYYLFQLINQEWHNGFLDALIPVWRNKLFWIPFYIFLLAFLVINFAKKGWIIVLCLGLTIVVADAVSSKVVKPLVHRVRPCNDAGIYENVRQLVRCGSGYSFTSSHATNHTAIAFFLIFILGNFWKWIRLPLFFWAFSVGYGQIYVGVHYPMDVIGGMLIGFIIGLLGAEFCRTVLLYLTNETLNEEMARN